MKIETLKKMLKNIFAKNRRKNLHKHPGPPFQIRPGPGYFSRAQNALDPVLSLWK